MKNNTTLKMISLSMAIFMLASVASFAQRGRDRDERYDRYDNRYRNSRGPVIVYQQRNPFYIGYETRFMPRDARIVVLNGCRHYAYNGYLYREMPRRNGLISFQITARL